MTGSIRTFIGIPVAETPAIGAMLRELKGIGRGVRVTAAGQLHLTVKFLGETSKVHVPAIGEELREAARLVGRHPVELVGLGAFPNAARASVVWAGIEPQAELKRFAAELDRRLSPLGFAPESRPYHPHLTLARVDGRVAGLGEFLASQRATPLGGVTIDRVVLYQSELGPRGSVYSPIVGAELG
ncbi:MAG TPA: RNA 2',3'-cyclic phosphodiesterase [Caulifigura sp.]|nr:RNA 2',3'-cyclic phosphodiesterase [Caulifigura sp.]